MVWGGGVGRWYGEEECMGRRMGRRSGEVVWEECMGRWYGEEEWGGGMGRSGEVGWGGGVGEVGGGKVGGVGVVALVWTMTTIVGNADTVIHSR